MKHSGCMVLVRILTADNDSFKPPTGCTPRSNPIEELSKRAQSIENEELCHISKKVIGTKFLLGAKDSIPDNFENSTPIRKETILLLYIRNTPWLGTHGTPRRTLHIIKLKVFPFHL